MDLDAKLPPFTRLLILLLAYGSFGAMHWSLVYLFFRVEGYSVPYILLVVGVLILGVFAWSGDIQTSFIVPAVTGVLYLIVVALNDLYPEEVFLLKPMRGILRQG